MHRMTWPEVICVAVSVLGIALATAWLLAGNGVLAFLGVIASGGAWATYDALADARESQHVRPLNVADFRRAPDLDIPDYEAHTLFDGRVLCGQCGELGPLWTMAPHPVYGHRCHAHARTDAPEVA